MIARLRQRRALPPAIRRRIVFLVARHRFARDPAAEREELVADRRRRDLAAHRRHRCFLGPFSARRLRPRGGTERGNRECDGESKRQRSEATTHANLQFYRAPRALECYSTAEGSRAMSSAARVTATSPVAVSRTTLTVPAYSGEPE